MKEYSNHTVLVLAPRHRAQSAGTVVVVGVPRMMSDVFIDVKNIY